MKPVKIKIIDKDKLFLVWENGGENLISLKYLRDECPCANCKGETILFKTFRPPARTNFSPETYQIQSIEIVGDYAIQVTWKDGHNTGIYSWEYLKKLIDNADNNGQQNYNTLL